MRLHRYLIHRCTVERLTLSRGDVGEDVRAWATWKSMRCRLLEESQVVADSALGQPVQYDYRISLDPVDVGDLASGTSLLLTDRVKYVTLETGSVLTGPFRIVEMVTSRRKKAELVTVSIERISESSAT